MAYHCHNRAFGELWYSFSIAFRKPACLEATRQDFHRTTRSILRFNVPATVSLSASVEPWATAVTAGVDDVTDPSS
jgi:hypothetical protein